MLVFKSHGDRAQVLDYDSFLEAHHGELVGQRNPANWKRVLKRIDLTSRTLVTLVEPGSCFVGTLAEFVFAADRSYMLIGPRRATTGRRPQSC